MDKSELLIKLISYIGNVIYCPIKMYRKHTFNINNINRILIVAYRHGIGTFVLLTPFLKTLKKNIPLCEITLLVDSNVVAELACNCKYIDKIINKKGLSTANLLKGIRYFKKEIASDKYNLTVSTIYERTTRNAFWTYFSGAPYRISFDKSGSAFLDTHIFDWHRNIHEVENYLQMLKGIGCSAIYDDLNLEVAGESKEYATHYLKSNNISKQHVVLGIHPGAKYNWHQKRWPLNNFIEVAERFLSEFKAKVIFFGGPDEEGLFLEMAHSNPNFILANKMKINHIHALIGCCSVFLSNDSGLMHVAASQGIPTIAVFGPTNPRKNAPWKVTHKIITSNRKCSPCYDYKKIECQENVCMESILTDQIFHALKNIVQRKTTEGNFEKVISSLSFTPSHDKTKYKLPGKTVQQH